MVTQSHSFPAPICCGEEDERIRGSVVSPSFLSPIYIYMASRIKKVVVWVSQDSALCPLPPCLLAGVGMRSRFESATAGRCVPTHSCFLTQAKQGNDTQLLSV